MSIGQPKQKPRLPAQRSVFLLLISTAHWLGLDEARNLTGMLSTRVRAMEPGRGRSEPGNILYIARGVGALAPLIKNPRQSSSSSIWTKPVAK